MGQTKSKWCPGDVEAGLTHVMKRRLHQHLQTSTNVMSSGHQT
jgi:hypothetical protein